MPFLCFLTVSLLATGCCLRCDGERDVRGPRARAPDGGTTLTVAEATPGCALKLDGKAWAYPLGVAGPVTPGFHTVSCSNTGESIDVETPAGFASTLDYWGP